MENLLLEMALHASGVNAHNEIVSYQVKLDQIFRNFISTLGCELDPPRKAENLFHWLWEEKPSRYEPHGRYKINEIIDAQLDPGSPAVGNCLGLTLLYNCLLRKLGLKAKAVYLETAFDLRPHVFSLIETEESFIDVENMFPTGFDYPGHRDNPSRIIWGDRELVADIHFSLGNEFFEKREWEEAFKSYNLAIRLNPNYEKAFFNRAMVLDQIRMEIFKEIGERGANDKGL